jgi:hypothetical protein
VHNFNVDVENHLKVNWYLLTFGFVVGVAVGITPFP